MEAGDFVSMELLSALKAAAGSLKHDTLGIRHRERARHLPLPALGVIAGRATIQKPQAASNLIPSESGTENLPVTFS